MFWTLITFNYRLIIIKHVIEFYAKISFLGRSTFVDRSNMAISSFGLQGDISE